MKEIEYYIESNTKLMQEKEKELKNTTNERVKEEILIMIERYKYYIMGLQDAKKYIESELK